MGKIPSVKPDDISIVFFRDLTFPVYTVKKHGYSLRYTGKGEEMAPLSVLAASMAGCMLLSIGAQAQRNQLEITGTRVEVEITMTDKQADFRAIRSKAEASTGSALSLHMSEFALFVGLSQRTDNLFSCFNNFFCQRFLHQRFFFI